MKRILEYGACVLVSVVATTMVSNWMSASARPAQHLSTGVSAAARGSLDSSIESKSTPIPPCRIVDTRHAGGKLVAGAPRGFIAAGTAGFDAQGGAVNGCGVPKAATAI